jgi:magnesium transporter
MQIQHNNVTWKNLANPDFQDLDFLQKEIGVSTNVLKDLMAFNKRPKIEEFEGCIFLVIHFPVFNEETRQTISTELDFIATRDMVLTVYQNANPVLETFFKELHEDTERRADYFKNSGWLLFSILDKMIDSCLPMLDHIHEKIDIIENRVFEGKEKEMLKEIAIVKRDVIDFRSTIKPQRSVLEILSKKVNRFFKHDLDIVCQEVIGSEVRVWNTLENHKEMIEAIEATNHSLLSFQINQVMHTLTFFSIILFSLTFIAGFFSMKVFENSVMGQPDGIWIAGGVMLSTVLLVTLFFKRKKWL